MTTMKELREGYPGVPDDVLRPMVGKLKSGTCATCKHWQPAKRGYVAACTSRKAGLGAVIERSGSSAICRWDFDPL